MNGYQAPVVLEKTIADLLHEINNPLAVISGNVQFLISVLDDSCSPHLASGERREIRRSFRTIRQETERCSRAASQLLLLCRALEP